MVVGRFGKELEGGWIVEVDMVKVFNCRKI
jgi:hypothetical protein